MRLVADMHNTIESCGCMFFIWLLYSMQSISCFRNYFDDTLSHYDVFFASPFTRTKHHILFEADTEVSSHKWLAGESACGLDTSIIHGLCWVPSHSHFSQCSLLSIKILSYNHHNFTAYFLVIEYVGFTWGCKRSDVSICCLYENVIAKWLVRIFPFSMDLALMFKSRK